MDEGAVPPVTPINPYLGEMCGKNEPFLHVSSFTHTLEASVWS